MIRSLFSHPLSFLPAEKWGDRPLFKAGILVTGAILAGGALWAIVRRQGSLAAPAKEPQSPLPAIVPVSFSTINTTGEVTHTDLEISFQELARLVAEHKQVKEQLINKTELYRARSQIEGPEDLAKMGRYNGFPDPQFVSARGIIPPPRGIDNPGNACWMASIVQSWVMTNIPALRRVLPKLQGDQSIAVRKILEFVDQYAKGNKNAMSSTSIAQLINEGIVPLIPDVKANPSGQHDPQEVIGCLADLIYSGDPSAVQEIHRNFLTTQSGDTIISEEENGRQTIFKREEETSNPYYCETRETSNGGLFLPIPSQSSSPVSFASLFQKVFNRQKDENPASYKATVKDSSGITREKSLPFDRSEMRLTKAPDLLTISLKRFRVDRKTQQTFRIGTPVQGIEEYFTLPRQFFIDENAADYEFCSAIIHSGSSPHRGHYIAIVTRTDPNTKERSFFEANDSSITPLTREEALDASKTAYVLIYKKI